jgi:hypothetical protein
MKLNVKISASVMGLMLAAGCTCPIQKVQNMSAPDPVNDANIQPDAAMAIRDWDQKIAWYSNGDTPAAPTDFFYEPKWNQGYWNYAIIEWPLFVGQTVALPVTLVIAPPWNTVINGGVETPPTYTAMPPLPPSRSGTYEMAPPVPEVMPEAQPTPVSPADQLPGPVAVPTTQQS